MSVNESDIRFYASANMPQDNTSTSGGAIDFTTGIFFSDIGSTQTMDYVSSSASDTAATLQCYGRDSTGVIVSETKTLTGTTVVTGSQSFERLLKGVAAGTTAVGRIAAISHTKVISAHTAQSGGAASGSIAPFITLQSGDGATAAVGNIVRCTNNSPSGVQFQLARIIRLSGDIAYVDGAWGTVPTSATTYDIHQGFLFDLTPNQVTTMRRPFYDMSADAAGGSSRTYNEKIFAVNNNTTTALTNVTVSKQTDPSAGTFNIALCSALNDSGTVANRLTTPGSGITAYTSGSAPQSISSSVNLISGNAPNSAGALGIWLKEVLAAGTAAAKSSYDIRVTGTST